MDEPILKRLVEQAKKSSIIPPGLYEEYNVKKGLRNKDHTGVLVGLTHIGDVVGYEKNKSEIKEYYLAHSNDINTTGVIQSFLDEDEKLRLEREARLKALPTAEQLRKEKLRRIRENDQLKQERLQKSLEEEVIRKKHEIREYQKEELTR